MSIGNFIRSLLTKGFPMENTEVSPSTSESPQMIHHVNSPFWEIPIEPNEKIKVWDIMVPSLIENPKYFQKMDANTNPVLMGRMRVLAVCPKKPAPLDNINFSVAWCSPLDLNKYDRVKANRIVVGRWLSAFVRCKLDVRNTGTVKHLETLKGFPGVVIQTMGDWEVPDWVDYDLAVDISKNFVSKE